MERFDCRDCGQCCQIRNNTSLKEEDVKLLLEQAKKHNISYVADPRLMTFPLTAEEKEVLLEEARNMNISLNIKPLKVLKETVLSFFMDHKVCPFYDKDKIACTIYDKRPLACRAFPILSVKHNLLGDCPKKIILDLKQHGEEVYGDTFDFALEFDKRVRQQNDRIRELSS